MSRYVVSWTLTDASELRTASMTMTVVNTFEINLNFYIAQHSRNTLLRARRLEDLKSHSRPYMDLSIVTVVPSS
jgi:hypothetical protein